MQNKKIQKPQKLEEKEKGQQLFTTKKPLEENLALSKEKLNEMLLEGTRKNNIEMVKKAIEAGADKEATNENGDTALMIATFKDYREILLYLLEKGARGEFDGFKVEYDKEKLSISVTSAIYFEKWFKYIQEIKNEKNK